MSNSAYSLIKKRTTIPSSTKPIEVLRAKVVKVSCSNIHIQEIVEPVMRVTSIMMLTQKPSELPELSAIVEILQPAKILLAKIMTLATQETFLPAEISNINVSISAGTGQFRAMLYHTRNTLDKVTQPYTLSFSPASELDLFHAYLVRHKSTSNNSLKIALEKL